MSVTNEVILEPAEFSFSRTAENGLMVILKGHWIQERKRPPITEIMSQMNSDAKVQTVAFDSKALADWDSTLLTFLTKIVNQCRKKQIRINLKGLPNGVQRMLKLVFAVPEKKGARKEFVREHLAARIGGYGINAVLSSGEILAFLGEAFVAFLKFLIGKARFRRSHLILYIQEAGRRPGPSDRNPHQCSGGPYSGFCGCCPAQNVWCPDLCGQSCRTGHDPRDGGNYVRNYHGRAHRIGLCRPNRHHAGQRRD